MHGCFSFAKNHGFHFRKLPMSNGTAFSIISGKEDNLACFTQIYENLLPGNSVPLISIPKRPEFSVEWCAVRKFNSSRIPSKEIFVSLAPVSWEVLEFLVEWKVLELY